jgi:HAMP domain-containing protein
MLPGLIFVDDLIRRLPTQRVAVLGYEIRRRERELLYIGSTRQVLSYHFFSAAKVVLAIGIIVFAFVWTFGQITQIARWILALQQWSYEVPIPFENNLKLELGKHLPLPTSTWIGDLSKLPTTDWRQATWFAVVAMLIVVLEQAVVAFFAWQRSQRLKSGIEELEKELEELKRWQKARDVE